ncbi:MAG: hypothetical protein RL328_1202, partial [Acidobacteriota bacterium]
MPNRSHPGPDQQELLLQFVRQLPVAVAMFDRGLRCLHASNRWGAIFGVGPAEMVGRAPQEVVPDFPDTWLSWMHRGLAGETLSAEEEQIEWQGRLMWIRWSISPWGTLDGLPAGVLVFVEDVTVGKAAQAALAQSEQEFRDLVESSPDGIARLDLDGRYLFANQRMADWGQVKTTDFPGRLLGSFAIPGIEFWQPIVQRVIQSKRPETVRYSSPAESGGRGVRVRLIPELLSDGAVDSVLVIATDISDLEQAESLATERESLIATMFEAAAQGIVGVDASGLIQVANGMAEGMFGYSSGELLNQPLDILIPDDCRRAHALHFAGFIQEAGKRPMDRNLPLSGRRKDGSVFPVDVSLSSARSRGVFLGVAFITDTSERERQNSALRSQQEELQKLKADLYAAEEAAARDLARELHDDITQRLAFLSIEIGKAAVEQDPAASILPRLRSFQSRIQQISEDVREISHRMHPSIL